MESKAQHPLTQSALRATGTGTIHLDDPARFVYMDDDLIRLFGGEGAEDAWIRGLKENFLQAVPEDLHDKVRAIRAEALAGQSPLDFEHDLLRKTGERIRIIGRLERTNEDPSLFQVTYIDVTDTYQRVLSFHRHQYLKILTRQCDVIFEFDITAKTLRLLHARQANAVLNVDMQFESAIEHFLHLAVNPEDWDGIRTLAAELLEGGDLYMRKDAPHFSCRALDMEGQTINYYCELLFLSEHHGLCCCYNEDQRKRAARSISAASASPETPTSVHIQTFGHFNVFVDNKPVLFHSRKAKELLALLVDRSGGYVSSQEAASYLWEDEAYNKVVQARYRKTAMRLRDTLRENGIENILQTENGNRRLVTEAVECDLYLYLTGDIRYRELFGGSYLVEYSWAEPTLAKLLRIGQLPPADGAANYSA